MAALARSDTAVMESPDGTDRACPKKDGSKEDQEGAELP